MPINNKTGKTGVVDSHNEILESHEGELHTNTGDNMDESHR